MKTDRMYEPTTRGQMRCNFGKHKGKILCYEYCAHGNSLNHVKCRSCRNVRSMDSIVTAIEDDYDGVPRAPSHLIPKYGEKFNATHTEIREALWHGVNDGRLNFTSNWRVEVV